jgi:hypothetical protein
VYYSCIGDITGDRDSDVIQINIIAQEAEGFKAIADVIESGPGADIKCSARG